MIHFSVVLSICYSKLKNQYYFTKSSFPFLQNFASVQCKVKKLQVPRCVGLPTRAPSNPWDDKLNWILKNVKNWKVWITKKNWKVWITKKNWKVWIKKKWKVWITLLPVVAALLLQLSNVLDGHLNDFSFLDSSAAFFQVRRRDETRQVGQTAVHPVAPTFLDQPVRCQLLRFKQKQINVWYIWTSMIWYFCCLGILS